MLRHAILSLTSLASIAQAHMQLAYPPPFNASNNPHRVTAYDDELLFPYNCCGDVTPFPCRGYLKLLGTPEGAPTASWPAGSQQQWSMDGPAPYGGNHYGGSCQIGFSIDQGKTFRVATSYEGNCPHRNAGELAQNQLFDFTVPSDLPVGDVLFAWTWFNREQEFFMNCAAVTITQNKAVVSGGSSSAPSSSSTGSKSSTTASSTKSTTSTTSTKSTTTASSAPIVKISAPLPLSLVPTTTTRPTSSSSSTRTSSSSAAASSSSSDDSGVDSTSVCTCRKSRTHRDGSVTFKKCSCTDEEGDSLSSCSCACTELSSTNCNCSCPSPSSKKRSTDDFIYKTFRYMTPEHHDSHVIFTDSSVAVANDNKEKRAVATSIGTTFVPFNSRPEMFYANMNNGCLTPKTTKELLFPNPGPNVIMGDGEYPLALPTGTCK